MSIAANLKVLDVQLDIHLSNKTMGLIRVIGRKFIRSKVSPNLDELWNEFC